MTTRSIQVISIVILVMFELCSIRAQNPYATFEYGNEWIQSNLTHYEFFIEEDGIYDLVLEANFFEADNPCNYKIYRLGSEVATFTRIDDNGNSHILFYGEKNRGQLDQALYEEGNQLNPDYSLFSDKAAYYLVSNTDSDCNRLSLSDQPEETDAITYEHFWYTEQQIFNEYYFKPKVGVNLDLQSSEFDVGEGFGSALSNDHRFLIRTVDVSTNAPNAVLNIRFAGNVVEHDIEVIWNDVVIDQIEVSGYGVEEREYSIPVEQLLQTNELTIQANNGDLDKLTIASYSLRYPREATVVLPEISIELDPSESIRSLPIDTSRIAVIIDRENQIIYQSFQHKLLEIQSSVQPIHLFSASQPIGISSDQLTPVQFTDYQTEDPSYVILTNDDLRETTMTGEDEIEAYASYRSSEVGGGHTVLIVDVLDLYRQFAFGQRSHPLAIKQFVQSISSNWTSVEGFFIVGKGRDYYTIRSERQKQDIVEFVPTYGSPGSDNLLISDNASIAPLFPIGRLAAQNPQDVKLYLDKIKMHEQQAPSEIDPVWRKRVLHLSGGSSDIVDAVAFLLQDLEELIEQSAIGASVETFRKTSAAPIQPAQTKDLLKRINDGVSLITFLGHSSPGTFDFSLEEPSAYDNIGQLPFIISLGCHSGNIHSEGFGLSEQFVLEPEKGAIAFLASSSSNYLDVQYLTGRILYLLLGDNFHNQPVGRALQEILILTDQLDASSLALNEQFTLHGDPLVQISFAAFPDLQVDESSAFTEPAIITSTIDSFQFAVDIINAGKSLKDSVSIVLTYLNDSDSILYQLTEKMPIPAFSNQLKVSFPAPGLTSIGDNRIVVTIDPENKIDEGSMFAEENNQFVNTAGIPDYRFEVLDQVIRAVYPEHMSIVNTNTVHIKASTSNALTAKGDYLLEIDTTILFNSPILESETITNVSGLIEWDVDLPLDETVYYWKVSNGDQNVQNKSAEQVQSFLYSSTSEKGWNQSHFYQYTEDEYSGLVLGENRQLQFDTSGFYISIHNRIYNPAVPPGYQFNFENFAASVNPWLFLDAGIAVVVGDQLDGSALLNEGGGFGSVFDTSESSRRVFGFKTETTEQRSILLDFLKQIPTGQYVFLFTVIQDENSKLYGENWLADQQAIGDNIISYLESEGATHINGLTESGTLPYNFIYQKDVGPLGEAIAKNLNQSIRTDVFIPRLTIRGDMQTNTIGPAKQWISASLELFKEESDTLQFVIVGIEDNGEETVLLTTSNAQFNLTDIDALLYPYIKVIIKLEDGIDRTASQLNHLRIFYEGLPDLALDPIRYSEFSNGNDGEISIGMGITNTSMAPMPSTEVSYSLSNTNGIYLERTQDIPALDIDGVYEETISFDAELVQPNTILKLELNPSQSPAELYHFNNVAVSEIDAIADIVAPVLDVTFDGAHIQNGEIVSPNPIIVFEVRDEDRTNPVSSVNQFGITIRKPDGRLINVIEIGDELSLKSGEDNLSSQLVYTPEFEEGDYQLTATVFDAAANESSEYQVIFKVITRKTISELTFYPNPMKEAMRFEYFVTGELDFEIHVYNAAGKLVKQFRDEELGSGGGGMRESAEWNGTDDAGNLMPSGVYTYRIMYDENDPSYLDFLTATGQAAAGQFVIIR